MSSPAVQAAAERLANQLRYVQLPIEAWEEIAEKVIRTYIANGGSS
jgi:hypothetical protein